MSHRPESIKVVPTDITVPKSHEEIPKKWMRNDSIATYLGNVLSLLFPAGESFFVHTIRNYRDFPVDAEMKKDLVGFVGQENMHSIRHADLNKYFDDMGCGWIRKFAEFYLETVFGVFKLLPRRHQLAMTVALEHMTAVVSEKFLAREFFVYHQHPSMRAIFVWHSIEEIEHKDVVFNLYKKVGGNYFERVFYFFFSFFALNFSVCLLITLFTIHDRTIFNPYEMIKGIWFQIGWNGFYNPIFRGAFTYLKPGFHPWDEDTSGLVQKWRNILAETNDWRSQPQPSQKLEPTENYTSQQGVG